MDYVKRAKFFRTKKRLGQNFLVNPDVISDMPNSYYLTKDYIDLSNTTIINFLNIHSTLSLQFGFFIYHDNLIFC